MARFYAAFNNTGISALEAINASNAYQRVTISNGSTLKDALVSTRSALSAAALAEMNAGNRDGSLGIVVPTDAVTRSGGNYSWSNLYTNTGAIWPSDPRVRPNAAITIAGSTAVSPTDAGSVTESLYTDAQTAVENVLSAMTGGGPRGRIGLNPYRTLASLWHDHDLSFFAWDDFTPGQPQTLTISGLGGTTDFVAALTFTYEYLSDKRTENTAQITVTLTRTDGGGSQVYTQNRTLTGVNYPSESGLNVAFTSDYPLVAGTYQLSVVFTIEDAVITTQAGTAATAVENNVTIGSI
jgi:hypothetical protein